MSNMSYCRFENTLPDLQDCLNVLEGYGEINSEDEKRYAKKLITTMVNFLENKGIVESYEETKEEIDNIIESVCTF